MRALLAIAASFAALVLGHVAWADTTTVEDGRNARANLLDIQSATASHRNGLLQHTIRTYRAWSSSALRSSSRRPRLIAIYVWKTQRNSRVKQDFELLARFRKGKLRGSVIRVRPRKKTVGKFVVRRLDRRSITFTFDASMIGSPTAYLWQAVSGFTGKGCPKVRRFQFGCDDSAPTGEAREHNLAAQSSYSLTTRTVPSGTASTHR
jgi:hypothetical protein